MSIESPADWRGLKQVAKVARLTLDALAAQVFAAHRARSAPALVYGFPGTVLISVNDEIVHGIPGARRISGGDIVKIDVTVEKDAYVADAARSIVVEPGNPIAHRLVACATAAFQAALAVARAGVRVNEIRRAVEGEVRRRGFSVVEGLSGHGVGRTIHEEPTVPNRYDPFQRDVLTEGLVLTIEPMISAGSARVVQSSDGWALRTRDGSLSAHHEHTLVITRGTPIVLTGKAA